MVRGSGCECAAVLTTQSHQTQIAAEAGCAAYTFDLEMKERERFHDLPCS
jgi:hypothetical protein